jgi:hypothetical protein
MVAKIEHIYLLLKHACVLNMYDGMICILSSIKF